MSNLYSYGFKEAFFGSGISKVILSSVDIFFDGSFTIKLFILRFSFKIKFFTLVLLNSFFFFFQNKSTLISLSESFTINLMIFFIIYNINTICARSSTG